MKSDEHIELLQTLVDNFQSPELMDKLIAAKTADEYYGLVCNMPGMDS